MKRTFLSILPHDPEWGDDDLMNDQDLYKGFIYDGTFEIEIAQNKKITLRGSTMSGYDISTPMTGFTKAEIEEYYSKFSEERGRFDDILIMNELELMQLRKNINDIGTP